MVACNTGWGRVSAKRSGASTLKSGSYALKSLQHNQGHKGTVQSHGDNAIEYSDHHRGKDAKVDEIKTPRQEHNDAELGNFAAPTQRDQRGADETSQSVASNDSTQMIIRREVVWTVTYEDESPGENNNHPHGNPTRATSRVDIEAQTHPIAP